MFRWAYRVGLLLGAVLLALFIGAKLIHLERGDQTLAELYIQSSAVSHSLADVSEGLDGTATAVCYYPKQASSRLAM